MKKDGLGVPRADGGGGDECIKLVMIGRSFVLCLDGRALLWRDQKENRLFSAASDRCALRIAPVL